MPQMAEHRGPLLGHLPEVSAHSPDEKAAAQRHLALSDRSALPKLGVKGAGAGAWLRDQGVEVPPATYDTLAGPEGGLIARLGTSDFFLEAGPSDTVLSRLSAELDRFPHRVYRVERQD